MTMQDQLLDAIGQIDETLLLQPKTVSRRLHVGLIAAVLAVVLACGAFAAELLQGKMDMDTAIAGSGRFLFHEDQIFFESKETGILALDIRSGTTHTIATEDRDLRSLFIMNGKLGYVRGFQDVVLQTESSDSWETLLSGSYPRMFLDGSFLYSDNGLQLQRTNLKTGETEVLVKNTHGYFVDEENLYVLVSDRGNVFLKSKKDSVSFEEISLSFYPAAVYAHGEDLYFSRYAAIEEDEPHFRVFRYRDGKETPLPIYSALLQIVGQTVYYLQDNTLKAYHTETETIEVLYPEVFEFSVLEGRYLCLQYLYDGDTEILDLTTGKTIYSSN